MHARRPQEVRGLRFDDIGENTIRVRRAVDDRGRIKSTKNRQNRSVKLFAALAEDLLHYKHALGRVAANSLIIQNDGNPWTKSDWNMWVADRWRLACLSAGTVIAPRPYDLRHSLASLLLHEGRRDHYVARQMGHSTTVLHSTYEHLIEEYEEAIKIDAEAEIAKAREIWVALWLPSTAQMRPLKHQNPGRDPGFWQYRYRDSNPGYRRERAAS
jgi:integrase